MKKIKIFIGKKIQFVDLLIQYEEIKKEINDAVLEVLASGKYLFGPQVELFEKEFRNFVHSEFAVSVASGTDALTLSLKALSVKSGEGVILPANCYPSAFGVALSGAKLQLADVDSETLLLTVGNIEKVCDSSTKAIVVVHLYGNPVDLDPILKFASEKGIYVIEDCAQAIGATYKGRVVGSLGDVGCFSFYPTKNLGAYGDGGVVVTNHQDIASKLKKWRMYGEEERYKSILIGYNSRLDELQAAILRVKLRHLNKWNGQRIRLAEHYIKSLNNLPVRIVRTNKDSQTVRHLFVIQAENRDKLQNFLKQKNISTSIHYPSPIHLIGAFSNLGYHKSHFPISEEASASVLSLPLYPGIQNEDIEIVSAKIREFYHSY